MLTFAILIAMGLFAVATPNARATGLTLAPAAGSVTGNETVVITGEDFATNAPTAITIDGQPNYDFTVDVAANTLTIDPMPAHPVGAVPIDITFADSSTEQATYTYQLFVDDVAPGSGTTHGGQQITVSVPGMIMPPQTLNYVQGGLEIHYDAINNLGTGDANHSNTTTTWTDLSGNGRHGTLVNFANPTTDTSGWSNKYLSFDGTNDWVRSVLYSPANFTLQIVTPLQQTTQGSILGNWESGGAGFTKTSSRLYTNVYIGGAYREVAFDTTTLNSNWQIRRMSSIYDGTGVRGVIDNTTSFLATTGALAYNTTTVWALGTNPRGTSAYSDFYNGRFSAVRIYSRALSANELCQNDWVDYYRFGGTLPDCLLGSLPTPTITATVAGELCTNLTIQNANQLTCLTPESPLPGSDTVSPYREGTVDVVVTVDGVDTTSSDRDNYTYVAPMAIASVTPNSGLITGGTEITISGPFAVPSGYVPSGLVVHYDGIDNTSSGHSSTTTTWKNLVSSSYDGTLTGTFSSDFGWGANHLQFKGSNVSRFVDTGSAHNIDKPTVEVVMSGSASGGTQMLAGNVESSGYGLALSSTGQPHFMSYIGSNYAYVYSNAITSGQVTSISGSFDGSTLRLITTGAKTQTVTAGSIKASSYAFTLGVNRGVSNIEPFVDGQIYAFRLYNRALTDAEVIANQMLDYMRFGGVPPVTVTLDYGGTPAACNNVKLIDENTIKCTTTAHAAGPVNVQVANSAMSATLPAAFTYYEEPFISLSVDSNLDISATPGILAADHVTANVKTNNPSGYDLSISASSVDLVCESDSSKKILALPSAAGPMSNNRWGYAVDGGSLTVPSSWKGVTNSLVPIAGSSTPTDPDTGVDTTVWVGTRVDYSLPVCSYIGNVTFTAVAWI